MTNNNLMGRCPESSNQLQKFSDSTILKNNLSNTEVIQLPEFDVNNILSSINQDFNLSEEKPEENLKIFFTKDKNLLDQYYKLRENGYRNDTGWKGYDGSESQIDRDSMIIVATNSKGIVVGGARFLIPSPSGYTSNEIPEQGYTIRLALEKAGLNARAKYSEISAVVIDKLYRNRETMKKIFSLLIEESKKQNCDYIVGFAILVASRDHKIAFKSLGYKLDVLKNFPWLKQKNHGYEQRFLLVAYLK